MFAVWLFVLAFDAVMGSAMDDANACEWSFGDPPVVYISGRIVALPSAGGDCEDAAFDIVRWLRTCSSWSDPPATSDRAVRALLRQSEQLRRKQDEWESYWHIKEAPVPGPDGHKSSEPRPTKQPSQQTGREKE